MSLLTLLASIALLAALAQWIAWWLRLPGILFLLLLGLMAGPVTGYLDPDALFGELLFPLVSLAVAVILFEGSLTLRFAELKGLGSMVRNLVTVGALITWGITAVIVYAVTTMTWELSVLFGAVVVVTGPTVIVPMLRSVRPNKKIAEVLRWEGIVIDPLGALFAVLAFNFVVSSLNTEVSASPVYLFLKLTVVGFVLGLAAAYALAEILRRYWLPDYLRSPFTLLLVLVVFALADLIEHEAGLLAVTVFGMALANQKGINVDDILDFKESLSVVLIGGLFILLAARLELTALWDIRYQAAVIVAGVIFVARPISVFISALGSQLSWRESALISWIGPRGIVCASVAAVFSLRLENLGVEGAELIVPLAFSVIIGTVVLQGLSAKWVAHMLNVRDPAPRGFLILGGGAVGQMLGKALKDLDQKVLLADSDWRNISEARMAGLETYYGNPVSEHADRYLDLTGIGNLFALSGRTERDVVATMHFREAFGEQQVFELPSTSEGEQAEKHRVSAHLRGRRLFGPSVSYNTLLGWRNKGAEVRTTLLTEEFDYDTYKLQYAERYLLLFSINADDRLSVVTDLESFNPGAGARLVSLILPETKREKAD